MAARMGHVSPLTAARMAAGLLATAALSAGALIAITLPSSPPASALGPSGKSLTIITEEVRTVGKVLATRSGLTLYRYTVDPTGKATCTGACAKVWPPLLLPKGVTHVRAPHGVKGLRAIRVPGGRLQVFFHGHALYRFVSDSKKGEATGQGVEQRWFAVLSNGKSSASKQASTSAPPATGGAATGTGPSTSAPTTVETPANGTATPAPPPVTGSTATTSPPSTTAPPVTTPPPAVPPATTPTTAPTPPTSASTTTTTSAPPTGGVGF